MRSGYEGAVMTIYDIIDDFTNCDEFEECYSCRAFTNIKGIDAEAGERVDYCRLLRTYKGMLVEALYKEIDKL